MSILIRKEGMLSTIQDRGRLGYRRFGINPNGAMDSEALRLINTLLDNDVDAPVIEMHFPAGVVEFEQDCIFALGGADFTPELNGQAISVWRKYSATLGDVLSFRKKLSGNRTYLSVKGGFSADNWLGSSSTNLRASIGGFHGRRLKTGDRIEFIYENGGGTNLSDSAIGQSLVRSSSRHSIVRVTAGPEFEALTALSQESLFDDKFRIQPNSDRMGFRLLGKALFRLSEEELLSSGVTFGTVQLLPAGQLIVLMADHQTTGGYPRILNVSAADLSILGQLAAGDEISFKLISLKESEELCLSFERNLALLRTGLRARRQGIM
jgi:antagonist of KipI